jgi:hypothetical protein
MQPALEHGEEVGLQCSCKLKVHQKKKGKSGSLVVTTQRLCFVYQSDALPAVQVWAKDITEQQVSKGDKFMMRVETTDRSKLCILIFETKADQDKALRTVAAARQAGSAVSALSTQTASRPMNAAAPSGPPICMLSGAERGKFLNRDAELRKMHNELVTNVRPNTCPYSARVVTGMNAPYVWAGRADGPGVLARSPSPDSAARGPGGDRGRRPTDLRGSVGCSRR